MSKFINILLSNFKYILSLYFIIQISLLFKFPLHYTSDSGYYFKLAQDCISQSGIYPLPQHLFENYIVAPLYVNLIALLLTVFNSSLTIGIFNIILNALQIILLYKITTIIIDEKAARISVILYILYLNNLGLVLLNLTELLFTAAVSSCIYFYLKRKSWSWLLAGIFCGVSIAIRPLGWALVISFLLIIIYKIYKKEAHFSGLLYLLTGLFSIILLFGSITNLSFGKFVYTSDNGPLNILMGANDHANGGYYEKVFEKGEAGYLAHPENLTYYQKQKFWKNQAVSWIFVHPVKWIILFPRKLFNMFAWDDISVSKLVFNNFTLFNFLKALKEHIPLVNILVGFSSTQIIIWALLILYHHLIYYFILFFFIFGLIKFRKIVFNNPDFNMLLLFITIGIIMTLIAVGDPRYKYPYLFIIFIFNSLFISKYLIVKEK
jgi:Dolichyl-phosphate-mannose-protein mannosyltransferase